MRVRYLLVTEASHNIEFLRVGRKETFLFGWYVVCTCAPQITIHIIKLHVNFKNISYITSDIVLIHVKLKIASISNAALKMLIMVNNSLDIS